MPLRHGFQYSLFERGEKMGTRSKTICALALTVLLAGAAYANWADSFDGGQLGLSTWTFAACPQVTGTYKGTVQTAADGNGYLVLSETTPYDTGAGKYGAAFGAAFGSPEKFKDVRVGATLNVGGDVCHSYYGLLARASYFIDPDGSVSGLAPGFFASCYIMHINYSEGPANLNLNLEKVLNNQNVMDKSIAVLIPRVDNARSYYAELEVVGAGPVYVTGRLYEYKGGPLVAQTPTMVDTDAKDWWEDADKQEKVYTEGVSGIFAQNEDAVPVGFTTAWDDVSSVSDGPSAVVLSPADGATGISVQTTLSWVEAKFATGRQLWLGKPGNLQLVDPAPTGTSYVAGLLEANTIYQWRVDEIGPAGTVQGQTWQFTTGGGLVIDDFESYANTDAVAAAWPHNIGPEYNYVLLGTDNLYQGAKNMQLYYQNQFEPYFTEATRTFAAPQDWTVQGFDKLSLAFRGYWDLNENDPKVQPNVEQPFYVKITDAAGNEAKVIHPALYAVQSNQWRTWDIALADFAGVDLKTVKTLAIGVGADAASAQPGDDMDMIRLDSIMLGSLPAE
jgi:hypothetical protein